MITLLFAALLACAPNPPTPPAAANPTEPAAAPAPAAEPAPTAAPVDPAPAPAEPAPVAPATDPAPTLPSEPPTALAAAGSACLAAADCASGVCEGEGCGDDTPGTCAPDRRACTRDARPYCGCDGATFVAGGNCPLRRYAHKGACAVAPPG